MAHFKYSGRITPDNSYHSTLLLSTGKIVAPEIITPPNEKWGKVAKYGETVYGKSTEYDPAGNCEGSFMSYKNQPNNNCYAYGTNIASNSFAQPGRASEGSVPWEEKMTAESVCSNAVLDGLVKLPQTTIKDLIDDSGFIQGVAGHFVALVFSTPDKKFSGDPLAQWGGDYHWVRADSVDITHKTISWSQKDGGDQVTNFDFAGRPISDPAAACWTVNQGSVSNEDTNDMIISYDFYTYMWVPHEGVSIL